MECCTRGSRAAHEELVGDDAGDAVASPRQQVVFDSVDLMEAWVAEGGWTCLLLVGNNAAGYTEQAYKVQSGWHTASYAFSTHMVNPWISRPILTRSCCGPTGCHGQRAAAIGAPADSRIGATCPACECCGWLSASRWAPSVLAAEPDRWLTYQAPR